MGLQRRREEGSYSTAYEYFWCGQERRMGEKVDSKVATVEERREVVDNIFRTAYEYFFGVGYEEREWGGKESGQYFEQLLASSET